MTAGGHIVVDGVSSTTNYKEFNLKFDKNVTITQSHESDNANKAKGREVFHSNASIFDGKNTVYDATNAQQEPTMLRLSETNYHLLNNIRKLDGNKENISEQDLQLAEAKKDKLGIKSIIKNIAKGIVEITSKDGWSIKLDYETETEEAARKAETTYKQTDDECRESQGRGIEMQDLLHGWTTDSDWREFNECIDEIDAKNVLQTLRGYQYESCDTSTVWNSERFFQQLFTEDGHSEDKVNAANKVITSLLEYIRDNKCRIEGADLNTLNSIEEKFATFTIDENSMTNGNGKELDNLIEKLFTIFEINIVY